MSGWEREAGWQEEVAIKTQDFWAPPFFSIEQPRPWLPNKETWWGKEKKHPTPQNRILRRGRHKAPYSCQSAHSEKTTTNSRIQRKNFFQFLQKMKKRWNMSIRIRYVIPPWGAINSASPHLPSPAVFYGLEVKISSSGQKSRTPGKMDAKYFQYRLKGNNIC